MMKYIKPEMDILFFENSEVFTDDIIHASNIGGNENESGGNWEDLYKQF